MRSCWSKVGASCKMIGVLLKGETFGHTHMCMHSHTYTHTHAQRTPCEEGTDQDDAFTSQGPWKIITKSSN